MEADLKDARSGSIASTSSQEDVYSSSYQSRLYRQNNPVKVPTFNPIAHRRYNPNARSMVSSGMMSGHYTSDPMLAALRFQAAACPTVLENPNSEWARYVADCQIYLESQRREPAAPQTKEAEGCCVIL